MIPYGRQSIDEADIDSVVRALKSDWLTTGPFLRDFEERLAITCHAEHAVACNSGTAALHMAYEALGVGVGSVVVVPANTFLATANAAIYLGAEVRFCDVDPSTGLMTAQALEPLLDPSVSVIAPVHFAGQATDMAEIIDLVQRRSPRAQIVEDASHAIGGSYNCGAAIGSQKYAVMTTFSFHPVKHIAAGEGGAVTTNDSALKQRLERFRCHGMTKDRDQLNRPDEGGWYYEMHRPGFNYRIPEMSCALAFSQIQKLSTFVARRREIADRYLSELQSLEHVTLPPREHLNTSAWHLFCLHVDFEAIGSGRQEVMDRLRAAGVGSQVHYYPVPLQPFYEQRYGLNENDFPGAVAHYRTALSIPMYAALSDAEVDQVIDAVRTVLVPGSESTHHRAA